MTDSTPYLYQGARLRLREFGWRDVHALVQMHRDPRVRAHLADDVPLDDARVAHQFVENMQQFYRLREGTGIWCAERAHPPEAEVLSDAQRAHACGEIDAVFLDALVQPRWSFCGWFSLVHLSDDLHTLEIGARLTPQAWGGALALDGGEWLLEHAFRTLSQSHVLGHCSPTNRSAAHCLQVLGFQPQGLAPYNGGQALRFGLCQSGWAAWHAQPRRERQRAVLSTGR
ncbi:MAG: GNAT family N-acetyltransferase [Acidovorax sp.]|nr:GNAT family N-acetyltransferase [Acidovorax sp.]